ncbi:hypothetical protein [Cognaticolwellia mytili]|uniref:hypothetical protein n=1 Tax=Cognaticolwellia mytili TaxID=1888913 RepID=UPI000A16FFC2|nr:hypothetical protein [Cognaticolwellia mytili]
MNEIPNVDNKGSEGAQVAESKNLDVTDSPPFNDMSQVVQGLAANHTKSLGGELASKLLAGSFTQLTKDLNESRKDVIKLRNKLDAKSSECQDWKETAIKRLEKLKASSRVRKIGMVSITIGATVIGIGVELYKNKFNTIAIVLSALGALLLLIGWFADLGDNDDS